MRIASAERHKFDKSIHDSAAAILRGTKYSVTDERHHASQSCPSIFCTSENTQIIDTANSAFTYLAVSSLSSKLAITMRRQS